jgi:hypothetical protein
LVAAAKRCQAVAEVACRGSMQASRCIAAAVSGSSCARGCTTALQGGTGTAAAAAATAGTWCLWHGGAGELCLAHSNVAAASPACSRHGSLVALGDGCLYTDM